MAKLDAVRRKEKVTVELGGKLREIKYDLNAFAELEKRYGSVQKAMDVLNSGSTMIGTRNILWAGLIHEEAVLDELGEEVVSYNITPYQVGSWIDPADLPAITDKLNKVFSADMPDVQEKEVAAKLKEQGFEVKNGSMVQLATVIETPEETAERIAREAEEAEKNV